MAYQCDNCGAWLAGMETCDCPVGQKAHRDFLDRLDSREGYPVYQSKPPRELRFRDIWWPVFYFFWNHTWFIRRIWCKHNSVHMSDSSRWGSLTVCANCYSPNVPQMCGSRPQL